MQARHLANHRVDMDDYSGDPVQESACESSYAAVRDSDQANLIDAYNNLVIHRESKNREHTSDMDTISSSSVRSRAGYAKY